MKNYIYIFLIAMVPLIELRGAIPVAYGIHTANPDFNISMWPYCSSSAFPCPAQEPGQAHWLPASSIWTSRKAYWP